jgi:hypothetical protein
MKTKRQLKREMHQLVAEFLDLHPITYGEFCGVADAIVDVACSPSALYKHYKKSGKSIKTLSREIRKRN